MLDNTSNLKQICENQDMWIIWFQTSALSKLLLRSITNVNITIVLKTPYS